MIPKAISDNSEKPYSESGTHYLSMLDDGKPLKSIEATSKKTHLCSFCKKTFTRNYDLKRHVQRIHAGGTVHLYYSLFSKILPSLWIEYDFWYLQTVQIEFRIGRLYVNWKLIDLWKCEFLKWCREKLTYQYDNTISNTYFSILGDGKALKSTDGGKES